MHFLITAGPTREYIDPVRFISNGSTGQMGYACAAEAVRRGHKVTLVSGPVALKAEKKVKLIKVVTAAEMAEAVQAEFRKSDCVVMTAAVSDYKPIRTEKDKIRKAEQSLTLKLQNTVDILAKLGCKKQHQILIGFAVQDRAAKSRARRKMREKNLDAIILNSPASIGAERSDFHVLQGGGKWESHKQTNKKQLAKTIITLAEKILEDKEE